MENLIEKYQRQIIAGIEKFNFSKEPKELYEPIAYIMSIGGKRIRPVLTLIGAELFNGEQSNALNAALAIELFHNFTLIHDDIMDNAPLRRGQPTVHEKWNRDVAILSGDAMIIMAYEQLAKVSTQRLAEILAHFNHTAFEVCEGQQWDMNFETQDSVSAEQYIKMIERKTAVLLGASLKIGALSANANMDDANKLYEFGRNIGIAFQLKDDWLDTYADPDKFGKRLGGDIIAGKKTYLLIKAIELADENQKCELEKAMSIDQDDQFTEKVERVKAIYDELRIGDLLNAEMTNYFNKGIENLENIEIVSDQKTLLKNLAMALMAREQ